MKVPRCLKFQRYIEHGISPEKLQSLLEEDHVASRQHDSELVAPVSKLAHERVERNRWAAGIDRKRQSDPQKRVMWALRSTAVFLELLAEAMWHWSELLEGKSKSRAKHAPG
jgi:hypothetical protein